MADGVNKKPVVHTHGDSKLQYLCGRDKVLFENGVTMDRAKFDADKDKQGAVITALTAALETKAGDCGYDWPFACDTGVLRRVPAAVPEPAVPKPARKRKKATAVAMKREGQKEKTPPRVFSSVFLVMAVMAVVGVGSAVMSAYHTSAFLLQGGKPAWAAVTTGIMLILFSGTAFTAARYFLQEKGLQKSFGFLFVIAGFAVIAYSVFSTVTVNFSQFKQADDTRAVIAVEDSEVLAAHERLLRDNAIASADIASRIHRFENEADYWKTMSWRRYDEFQGLIAEARSELSVLRQYRTELEAARPELVTRAGVPRETVYTFLAGLLGLPVDTARFFVYVTPACLYDILAPFALSVVLLLIDRRKKGAAE